MAGKVVNLAPLKVATKIRNAIVQLHVSEMDDRGRREMANMLDSIAITACELRAELENPGNSERREALTRRVRRALGYTYP